MEKITVEVTGEQKIYKDKSGISWRGLIARGIDSLSNGRSMAELQLQMKEKDDKIERMSKIIKSLSERQ